MSSWPPKELRSYEQLYLDENTLIFRNDLNSPYRDDTERDEEVLAFDRKGEAISAVARFSADGRLLGGITFGTGGEIDASTPEEMAAQIEAHVEGFIG